jgi:hypothetical protein
MVQNFYKSAGVLRYSREGDQFRLVVNIDPEFGNYYRALMPKYLGVSPQRYQTHITVVRPFRDTPTNPSVWGKYEGETIEFLHEPEIVYGKNYFWLRALSKRLEEIRTELGLGLERSKTITDASYEIPPAPFSKFWHITIANNKI